MTDEPKKKRGRPRGTDPAERRTDGGKKGSPRAKLLASVKKAFIEDAEKIYRRYCRGMPGLQGGYAHVVKSLEFQGKDVALEDVHRWARENDWDGKVADLDAKVYTALDDIKARRKALSPSGRAELEAARQSVEDLTDLAAGFIVKAQAALEHVYAENINDVVTLARAAKDIVESAQRVREAINRYTPTQLTDATADGKPVKAEMLSPPPASEAAPNLDSIVASFERGAKAPKH